jgi:uncharacterized protein
VRLGHLKVLLSGALALLGARSAAAASFDCSKPKQDGVAKAICANQSLSALDAEMGAAYQALFFLQGTSAVAGQRRWINQRSHCGPDASCLTRRTEQRLAALRVALAEAQGNPDLLRRLSAGWTKDDDLGDHQQQAADSVQSCPRAALDPEGRDAALVPKTYIQLKIVATHRCDAVVKVYLGCTRAVEEPDASEQWVGADGKWFACAEWNERLVLEDRPGGRARLLADLGFEVRTGNSGALFVPAAFTNDDRELLLKAWMGSPGAGGGDMIYGDELMSRATGRRRSVP